MLSLECHLCPMKRSFGLDWGILHSICTHADEANSDSYDELRLSYLNEKKCSSALRFVCENALLDFADYFIERNKSRAIC